MPSRRCSTSTTRASAGEWIPNELRRPREPRGDRLPAPAQRARVRARTPTCRRSPRSRPRGRWCRGRPYDRRARLRLQVGHGLDARHARVLRDAIRSTAATTTTSSPSACSTRSPRTSCCRCRTTRSCTARARCSRKMPGDDWQKFANLRLLLGYMYAQPGQEAAVHGRRVRPAAASGATSRASTGTCSTTAPHARRAALGARPEPRSTARSRRCTSATATRPASSGSTATTPTRASLSFLRRGRDDGDAIRAVAFNFTPVPRHELPGRRAARRAAGARSSTATPPTTAAAARATSAGSRRCRFRCTAAARPSS